MEAIIERGSDINEDEIVERIEEKRLLLQSLLESNETVFS